jgi:leader peptidase (prepilin peptidase)/N-methyltransferase
MQAEWVFLITSALAGAFVGSFLNVVIFRGAALWGLVDAPPDSRGDFVAPRSYCPHCKAPIAWFDLAPVLSYLSLGGKCRACRAPISPSYPAVEILAAATAAMSVAIYGVTPDAALCALALLFMIAIAETDRRTAFIPDALSAPFLWIGLLANLDGRFAPLKDAVIGAAGAYAAFALIAFAYRRLRGREGLGDGDAVLLAGIGAWCGWIVLPAIVLIGAAATLLWAVGLRVTGRAVSLDGAIAFGPGLCFAGGLALLAAQAPWNPLAR